MTSDQMDSMVGKLTSDETYELAKKCCNELPDTDCVELIIEVCNSDAVIAAEVAAQIEE